MKQSVTREIERIDFDLCIAAYVHKPDVSISSLPPLRARHLTVRRRLIAGLASPRRPQYGPKAAG